MISTFQDALAETVGQIEVTLDGLLPAKGENLIAEPMRYAVLNGGKRLRAFLVMESAALYRVRPNQAARAAAAIECMHAYSLVHDDLPCMDDDDLRRGKATVHVKWDQATAVLVGDALQTFSFEVLSNAKTAPDASVRLELIRSLAQAAGAKGMVLGQAQDIAAETAKNTLGLDQILDLQANKTGALICWAAKAGPTLARANSNQMSDYATALGLAFQIQDDILDVEGDAGAAGKRLQKDARAGKATFVSLLGMEGAKARATDLVAEACDILSPFGPSAENLRQVAQFVINRNM